MANYDEAVMGYPVEVFGEPRGPPLVPEAADAATPLAETTTTRASIYSWDIESDEPRDNCTADSKIVICALFDFLLALVLLSCGLYFLIVYFSMIPGLPRGYISSVTNHVQNISGNTVTLGLDVSFVVQPNFLDKTLLYEDMTASAARGDQSHSRNSTLSAETFLLYPWDDKKLRFRIPNLSLNVYERDDVVWGKNGTPIPERLEFCYVSFHLWGNVSCRDKLGIGMRKKIPIKISFAQVRLMVSRNNATTVQFDEGDYNSDRHYFSGEWRRISKLYLYLGFFLIGFGVVALVMSCIIG